MVVVFGLYLTVVFTLTVSPIYGFSVSNFGNSVNFVPLQALHTMTDNPLNFWGNILMFMPVGMLLVLLSNKCQNSTYVICPDLRFHNRVFHQYYRYTARYTAGYTTTGPDNCFDYRRYQREERIFIECQFQYRIVRIFLTRTRAQ